MFVPRRNWGLSRLRSDRELFRNGGKLPRKIAASRDGAVSRKRAVGWRGQVNVLFASGSKYRSSEPKIQLIVVPHPYFGDKTSFTFAYARVQVSSIYIPRLQNGAFIFRINKTLYKIIILLTKTIIDLYLGNKNSFLIIINF